jgi:hypothetical protein
MACLIASGILTYPTVYLHSIASTLSAISGKLKSTAGFI